MRAILESFTLDFNTIFNRDTNFSPYLHMLTQNFDKIIGKKLSTKEMLENNIWKTPPFNNPRDYNLLESREPEKFSSDLDKVITFEYKLMDILLREKIIDNDYNEAQIDFILASYRNCVFSSNDNIMKYIFNSKYFDSAPFFFIKAECTDNSLCTEIPNLKWNIKNNQIGIENASHRPLLLPFVVIADNIIARKDYRESTFPNSLGIFIFRKFYN
jgi:hypothetical protein